MTLRGVAWGLAVASLSQGSLAATQRYALDPARTQASVEADAGLSMVEGQLARSTGEVLLDREAGQGQVAVCLPADSLDFGLSMLNDLARGPMAFEAARFPEICYQGRLVDFIGGVPGAVEGELQMHGVTRPLRLAIQSFRCGPDDTLQREACSASAVGKLQRDEFGIDIGKDLGLRMAVTLQVRIVAVAVPADMAPEVMPPPTGPSADGVPE